MTSSDFSIEVRGGREQKRNFSKVVVNFVPSCSERRTTLHVIKSLTTTAPCKSESPGYGVAESRVHCRCKQLENSTLRQSRHSQPCFITNHPVRRSNNSLFVTVPMTMDTKSAALNYSFITIIKQTCFYLTPHHLRVAGLQLIGEDGLFFLQPSRPEIRLKRTLIYYALALLTGPRRAQ